VVSICPVQEILISPEAHLLTIVTLMDCNSGETILDWGLLKVFVTMHETDIVVNDYSKTKLDVCSWKMI
jgi:hypothetical protein